MNQHLPLNSNPTLMLEPQIQQQPTSVLDGKKKQAALGNHNTIFHHKQKSDFFEPNLEDFKPPLFLSPKITPDLINQLQTQKLLVLGGGSLDLDKVGLARHLACILAAQLQQQSHLGKIQIKEWYPSLDPYSDPSQKLSTELQKAQGTTIFILPHILPQHINYNLSNFQQRLALSNNYVLISTNIQRADWNLADVDCIWSELLTDELYSTDDLTIVLINKLKSAKQSLQPQLVSDSLGPHSQINHLTVKEIAARLKTPERIAWFAQLFYERIEPLTKDDIDDLLNNAPHHEEIIRRWFHSVLKPREQLIALGLNFFDGLFDDQCWAGMWKLIEHEWYRRDQSLLALDYCDLQLFPTFFRLVEIPNQKTKKFESKSTLGKTLFAVAWDSYRVRIQTALPVMVELVKNSVGHKYLALRQDGIPIEEKLYDNELRCDRLRAVIGEAISEIGLIDSKEVQQSLLTLASHSNPKVQAVAAKAIARWREYGCEQQLFDTLNDWKILAEKKGQKLSNNIMCTIALAVGYAGQIKLSKELCQELSVLSNHPSKIVNTRFGQWTLRMITPLHLVQLRDQLHDMTRNTNLVKWISESLASACLFNAQEVLNTLEKWYLECKGKRDIKNGVPRAALLQTVALTCANIICNQTIDPATVNEASQHLQVILAEEHDFDYKTIVKEIHNHTTSQNFQQVEPILKALVAQLTNGDRQEITKTLVKFYRQQRKQASISRTGNQNIFPVWITLERSPTSMEEEMLNWLKSENNPAAQMIGARLALGEELNLKNPQEVLKTLRLWYEKCKQDYPIEYEVLLTAVGLISIEILCDAKTTKVTEEARSNLHKILSQETLLFVRLTITNAICNQPEQRLLQIERQLKSLFPVFAPQELQQIIEAINQAKKSSNVVKEKGRFWHKTNQNVPATQIQTQPLVHATSLPKPPEKSLNEPKPESSKTGIKNNAIYNEVFPLFLSIIITLSLLSMLSYLIASFFRNSITPIQQPISNSRIESIDNNPYYQRH